MRVHCCSCSISGLFADIKLQEAAGTTINVSNVHTCTPRVLQTKARLRRRCLVYWVILSADSRPHCWCSVFQSVYIARARRSALIIIVWHLITGERCARQCECTARYDLSYRTSRTPSACRACARSARMRASARMCSSCRRWRAAIKSQFVTRARNTFL